jgi:uncharacterized protein YdhG (YjbR/CyaY superfamily)
MIAMTKFKTIDEYIQDQPSANQVPLHELRSFILEAVPEAEETFNYGVPAFSLIKGGKRDQQVMMAGFKKHTGFYPYPTTIKYFTSELQNYKTSEGTVQFPLDKPIPKDLVIRMVKFRKREIEKSNE